MVLLEFGARYTFVSRELVVSIVERGEHLKEAETSLLSRFGASDDVWVPRWVKLALDLLKLECAIAILVKLVEGLVDKALSKRIELSA